MNTNINKIIHIDGAPGITLEGLRGERGKNGGMVFFTDGDNSNYYSVFDMWSNDNVSKTPLFVEKHNYCEDIVPASRDYIITHIQNVTYVYIINNVISRSDIIVKDLSKYVESNILTQEYADNILNYYNGKSRHDCCLVTEISSLHFLPCVSNNLFDIEIIKTYFNLNYISYNGTIKDNKMETAQGSADLVLFSILAPDNTNIRNIRIEAEFYTDNTSPEMCSIYPSLWSNPDNIGALSMNYPFGYLENYNYKINYDDENLENFTFILKDFNEDIENIRRIPLKLFYNYTIYIYAYIPENPDTNSLNKYYITEFSGNDIIIS